MTWGRAVRAALLALIAVVVGVTVVVGLIFIPRSQVQKLQELTAVERFTAENDARRTLAQIIGGVGLFIGLFVTARRIGRAMEQSAAAAHRSAETARATLEVNRTHAHETLRLSREGEITARFNHAITHLADESTEVRLGGIYALERIARDSERDHRTVFEVLTAFVRERSRFDEDTAFETKNLDGKPTAVRTRITADAQAILTVIGRRILGYGERLHDRDKEPYLDLSNTNLWGADLKNGNFSGVRFHGAHLEESTLDHANLEFAEFTRAHLQNTHAWYVQAQGVSLDHANLFGASLAAANLKEATLNDADLRRAWLSGARLDGAELTKTDLREADLSGASLRGAQLAEAKLEGANFTDAHLEGANLGSVHDKERQENEPKEGLPYRDLTAIGLTQEQINSAIIDEFTILPGDYLEKKEQEE